MIQNSFVSSKNWCWLACNFWGHILKALFTIAARCYRRLLFICTGKWAASAWRAGLTRTKNTIGMPTWRAKLKALLVYFPKILLLAFNFNDKLNICSASPISQYVWAQLSKKVIPRTKTSMRISNITCRHGTIIDLNRFALKWAKLLQEKLLIV